MADPRSVQEFTLVEYNQSRTSFPYAPRSKNVKNNRKKLYIKIPQSWGHASLPPVSEPTINNTKETIVEKDKDGATTKSTTTSAKRDNGAITITTTVEENGTTTTTTTTANPDGTFSEEVKNPDGTSSTTKGRLDAAGRRMGTWETENRDENGRKIGRTTRTRYDEYGNPIERRSRSRDNHNPEMTRHANGDVKETFTHDDQSTTTTTTARDGAGKTTKTVKEEDEKGKETKSTTTTTDKDGKYTEEIKDTANQTYSKTEGTRDAAGNKINETTEEYGKDGKITRTITTEYYPNGKPSKQTEKDAAGNTTKETTFDLDGNPIPDAPPDQGFLPGRADIRGEVIMMPDQVEPGPITFTVAALNGAVLPNQEVTVSGGSQGSMTVKTDPNGQATVEIPAGWHGVKAQVLNSIATALVVRPLGTGGNSNPAIQEAPRQMTSSSLVNLHGRGFSHRPADNVVTIGGKRTRVVGAAPNTLTVVVPKDLPAGSADVQVVTNGRSSDPVKTDVIELVWDPGPSTLTNRQTVTRTLRIRGTAEPVAVMITDPSTDGVTSSGRGLTYSSGGDNNLIQTTLSATRAGGYSLRATLVSASEAEEDRRNAEFARRDAVAWRQSARNDKDQTRKQQKQNAAGDDDRSASDWARAVAARDKGNSDRAELLEQAARKREEAVREWGANANAEAAKKAEEAATALEDRAR